MIERHGKLEDPSLIDVLVVVAGAVDCPSDFDTGDILPVEIQIP